MQVKWYLRSTATADHVIQHGRNPNYLSFLPLRRDKITPTSDINEAVAFSDFVLFAVPSAYLEAAASAVTGDLSGKICLASIKGIVPSTGQIPSDYLQKKFGMSPERMIVIGGPCHAEEVAGERKTYVTIACRDTALATTVAGSLDLHYIRTVVNDDPLGVELSAILKNVVGIACGIARGLNYGDNFQAVLMANAMGEVRRFLQAADHRERDLEHSSYFGDLLVTGYSEYSRNRTFGHMIGRGYTVHLAQMEMDMVAEGYYAVKGVYDMMRSMRLELPVISAVYRILYNKISPYVEFKHIENQLT